MRLSDIIDRMKLPFRKEKELFSSLYQIMGFYPHNIEHYKVALIHKSSRQRTDKGKPLNNERLEFLGDAMLDAVVGHIVYEHFTQKREGFLTNTRSKLVSRDSLGKLAQEMGLTQLIQSNGGNRSGMAFGNIDSVGNVHPDQFTQYITLGNVRERPFGEIWTDLSNPIMAGLKDRKPLLKGRCPKCAYLNLCNGNFRTRAEAVTGDFWAEDPACYLTDEEIGVRV